MIGINSFSNGINLLPQGFFKSSFLKHLEFRQEILEFAKNPSIFLKDILRKPLSFDEKALSLTKMTKKPVYLFDSV